MDIHELLSQLIVPTIVGVGGLLVAQVRGLVKRVEEMNVSIKKMETVLELELPAIKDRFKEQDAKIVYLNTKILRR